MAKRGVTREQYEQVAEFRNRLVAYMNLILEHGGQSAYGGGPPAWVVTKLQQEQPWLSQTYGRLMLLIHPSGVTQGMAMGYGSIQTSNDVIADAIFRSAGTRALPTPVAIVVVLALVGASIWILERRVRPVEVVT